MRPRQRHAGCEKQRNRYERRLEENSKGRAIIIAEKQNSADNQRPDDGAQLVERLVKAKAAEPRPAGGTRQHRVARRRADRPSHSLGDDQDDRVLPISGECQKRHGEEV